MNKFSDTRSETAGAPLFLVVFAVAGLVTIIALSFWTSFTAQADVAYRAGVSAGQAWVWPVILDGLIVVATLTGLVVRHDQGARRYAWMLVWVAAVLSVAGNVLHQITTTVMVADPMPMPVRVVVACVPPTALLAVTHLTLTLTRRGASRRVAPEHVVKLPAPAQIVPAPQATQSLDVETVAPVRSQVIDPDLFDAWIGEWRAVRGSGQWPSRTEVMAKFGGSLSSAGRAIRRYKDREAGVGDDVSGRELVTAAPGGAL